MLPPYQDWEVLRSDALSEWQRVVEVLRPEGIKQSPSVTPTGSLWQQALTDLIDVDLSLASAYGLIKTETDRSAKQIQSKPPFIQLLKSWLEDDEQEQRDTWEYLKRALDEDRLSERKLFP